MGPLLTVSGIMRWCDRQGFYVERRDRRLLLVLPRVMAGQADELLHQHVSLHGWLLESGNLFVHSLANGENDG